MLDFIFSPAFAQAAAPATPPNALVQFAPLVVLFVLFYFLLIRPQMKRSKEQRQMIEKIAKGDELVLAGGLAGKVVNIGELYLTVEVADGVNVKVQKSAVTSVLPKGTLKTL
ncbi:preprotein translocase subunit YajC [Hydrocarboniphaga daqingensis]|uniref:Sec translocon accessory complex subunit YajC n=1 Tax=Hydrocarboniphaga daqingensis TaxID=490188 RepID=A0A1M5P1C9_9GAMM|nr:preprotein translocase subunit YajC [Hydrocarboniphaga daqingensis]SHG95610.1 preprotein translocase subunit YajC [Hydrocarboniphaga daqingensis]